MSPEMAQSHELGSYFDNTPFEVPQFRMRLNSSTRQSLFSTQKLATLDQMNRVSTNAALQLAPGFVFSSVLVRGVGGILSNIRSFVSALGLKGRQRLAVSLFFVSV